jgi:hypothetical protein
MTNGTWKTFAGAAVPLGLLQAGCWSEVFGFGLEHSDGDRLGLGIDLYAERVVRSALPTPARFAIDDFNCAGGFLTPDEVLCPAAAVQRRIDELCPCVCLAEWHSVSTLVDPVQIKVTEVEWRALLREEIGAAAGSRTVWLSEWLSNRRLRPTNKVSLLEWCARRDSNSRPTGSKP